MWYTRLVWHCVTAKRVCYFLPRAYKFGNNLILFTRSGMTHFPLNKESSSPADRPPQPFNISGHVCEEHMNPISESDQISGVTPAPDVFIVTSGGVRIPSHASILVTFSWISPFFFPFSEVRAFFFVFSENFDCLSNIFCFGFFSLFFFFFFGNWRLQFHRCWRISSIGHGSTGNRRKSFRYSAFRAMPFRRSFGSSIRRGQFPSTRHFWKFTTDENFAVHFTGPTAVFLLTQRWTRSDILSLRSSHTFGEKEL